MKRKRLEAWGVSMVRPMYGALLSVHLNEDAAHVERECYPDPRDVAVVRLVECGPDEVVMPRAAAAVVRAAVKWYRRRLPFDLDVLDEAVERMQKGRRK